MLMDRIENAVFAAFEEVQAGRKVMILVPNREWASIVQKSWKLPEIWVRASTVESGLKSVPIDTLILVGTDHHDWNVAGESYARERVHPSPNGRIIIFDPDIGD